PSSATNLCPAVPPTCAQQCHQPVPTSATYQCSPAVLPVSATISAQQLRQSMSSSAASQCPAVMPVSATYQCRLSVTPH
ncbi:unnamed protein product, partial [Staurois parvus]